MSDFTNPKIAAIDDGLAELDPCLDTFGRSHSFALRHSHEGSFNVPRRWLHRESGGIRQEIGLIIALPMPDRLVRGFHPEIPCTLHVAAFDRLARRHYHATVFEALPFRSVRSSLRDHLAEAVAKLDACSPDFIAQYGVDDEKG